MLFAAAPQTAPGSFPVGNRTQSCSLEEEHSWESPRIAQDGWPAQILLWIIANSGFCSCSVLPAVLSFFLSHNQESILCHLEIKELLNGSLIPLPANECFCISHTQMCSLKFQGLSLSFIFFLWCTLELCLRSE